jgi:hypothetical protein
LNFLQTILMFKFGILSLFGVLPLTKYNFPSKKIEPNMAEPLITTTFTWTSSDTLLLKVRSIYYVVAVDSNGLIKTVYGKEPAINQTYPDQDYRELIAKYYYDSEKVQYIVEESFNTSNPFQRNQDTTHLYYTENHIDSIVDRFQKYEYKYDGSDNLENRVYISKSYTISTKYEYHLPDSVLLINQRSGFSDLSKAVVYLKDGQVEKIRNLDFGNADFIYENQTSIQINKFKSIPIFEPMTMRNYNVLGRRHYKENIIE